MLDVENVMDSISIQYPSLYNSSIVLHVLSHYEQWYTKKPTLISEFDININLK